MAPKAEKISGFLRHDSLIFNTRDHHNRSQKSKHIVLVRMYFMIMRCRQRQFNKFVPRKISIEAELFEGNYKYIGTLLYGDSQRVKRSKSRTG